MKTSWTQTFRRLAAMGAVTVSAAVFSAQCYALNAFDNAANPAYADGWQAGDNGGSGFTSWNFDGSDPPSIHGIDSSSPFNDLGTSWRIAIEPNGLARAGRGFSPLAPGQTMQLVIDNPSERQFFKGYIIRFSTGGGNICYGGAGCTAGTTPVERLGVYTFEYFTNGSWLVSDFADDNHATTLTDVQTAAGGMRIDLTMTGPESYNLVMDPLGAAPTYMQSGNLAHTGTGAINWVEFVFFNTPTDPTKATDLYVSSMSIIPEPATGALAAAGAGVALVGMAAKRRRHSAT